MVKKTEWVFNQKRKKWQRKSPRTPTDQERALPPDASCLPCQPDRVPLCPERRVVLLLGEYGLHKGGSRQGVHHAAQIEPQGGSLGRRQTAGSIRASCGPPTRAEDHARSLPGAGGVPFAFGKASLQKRGWH